MVPRRKISEIVGSVVDCYQIEAILGQGGMGVVYKAIDTSLDRTVALKLMKPLLVEDEHLLKRFKAEAKALGRLDHPNIVSVFSLRHIEDYLFIVMEYVDGGTLADLIARWKVIPWQEALPIITQTLNALDYAHQRHVIHRDVKPRNILIAQNGIAKVTDFGLAKIRNLTVTTYALTRTGYTGGTLLYMPPEQLEGLANVDHRGDIYSLGMTYYEMLSGHSPFQGLSSEFAVLKAIDAHDFPPLEDLDTKIPAPLAQIIMTAVEREPEDRYQSAREMREALQTWLSVASSEITSWAPPRVPTPNPPRSAGRRPRRKRGRQDGSFFKRIKALLAKARSKASSHGVKARQDPKKKYLAPEPALPGSHQSHTVTVPEPTPGAPSPLPATTTEKGGGEQTLTHLSAEPRFFVDDQAQGVPAEAETEEAVVREKPAPSSSAESSIETPSVPPDASGEREPVLEVLPEPDAPVAEPVPEHLPHTLPPAADRAKVPPPDPKPRWKRPAFIVSAAIVLLMGLAYALTRPAADGLWGSSGGRPADAVATLSIQTDPEGVRVYIDDQHVGDTPLTALETRAGLLSLHLEKEGYAPLDTAVTVSSGETTAFRVQLHPPVVEDAESLDEIAREDGQAEAREANLADQQEFETTTPKPNATEDDASEIGQQLDQREDAAALEDPQEDTTVTTTPDAATGTLRIVVRPFGDIFIDNQRQATRTSRPHDAELATGIYRVRAEHPNYGRWEKRITVQAGETQPIVFNFNQTFQVSVSSKPAMAEIIVDGQPRGRFTPGKISLPPGQRTLSVRKDGYVMVGQPRTLTIEDDRNEPLVFTLQEKQ